MTAKIALACAALSCVSATAPAPTVTYAPVEQVFCAGSLGTAFRIRGGKFLSVAHVTSGEGCTIDGALLNAVPEEGLDFSVIEGLPKGMSFKINCDGFVPGQWYHAIGHARGLPAQTVVTIYATTYRHPDGMVIFFGPQTVIPGMSGGPVLNQAGEVVGMVNAYNPFFGLSFSRELKDTSLCRS
jgi:hypothetical protein